MSHNFQRIFLIVLDSVGIGNASDSKAFGDEGANTLNNIAKSVGLKLPNLESMGLGNIYPLKGINPTLCSQAFTTFLQPASVGKDSIAGHWELMGCVLKQPFNTFCSNGFPQDLIKKFEQETQQKVLGNKEANGLKIINEYGVGQLKNGGLIVYTSIDSTFQIAAHEEKIPLQDLYAYCNIARKLSLEKAHWLLSRVIARPFIGEYPNFIRTENRKDYALNPFEPTVLEALKNKGLDVIGLGKINDLYNGVGITKNIKTKNNADGIEKIIGIANENFEGLAFLNLVDFDSMYGHPRDPQGYKNALEYFDKQLPRILSAMQKTDLLILTADHGNDPTFKGNDHTRENVPMLAYTKKHKPKSLSPRNSFADVGTSIAENFGIKFAIGKSFLQQIIS